MKNIGGTVTIYVYDAQGLAAESSALDSSRRRRVSLRGLLRLFMLAGPLGIGFGHAQTAVPPERLSQPPSNELELRLRALVDTVQSLPTEYASDLLLELIADRKIADPKWRAQLLEDIFYRAPTAVNAYAKHEIGDLSVNDTVSGRQGTAYQLRLDSLSIQCRVVKLLVLTSPQRARELFNEIQPLRLTSLPCTDSLVYDVAIYFDTLHDLIERGFTPAQRQKGEQLELLRRVLSGIGSIEEAGQAARLLSEVSPDAADQAMLLGLYAGRLSAVTGNDRDFSYVDKDLAMSKSIQRIAGGALSRQISADALLRAYRGILLRYLKGARCRDSLPLPKGSTETVVSTTNPRIQFFNDNLASLSSDPSLRIPPDAVVPEKVLEGAKLVPLQFPDFHGLIHQLVLMQNQVSSDSGDWEKPVSDLLSTLQRSDDPPSCDVCRFHEKTSIYIVLMDLVPDGVLKDSVISSYLDFLARDKMQFQEPLEWLEQLKLVLRLTRSLSENDLKALQDLRNKGRYPTMLPAKNGKELLSRLQASQNPVISTYATKEALFPGRVEIPVAPK